MYSYNKLLGAIRERRLTQDELAEAVGMSGASLRSKLKGTTQFKADEIQNIMLALDLPLEDVVAYFFTR